jgi:fructoselysine-6-P-deglycase FrlB-like protein
MAGNTAVLKHASNVPQSALAAEEVFRDAGFPEGLLRTVLVAGSDVPGAIALPVIHAHPALEPLLLIQSFYRFAEALAGARGCDPDRPPHLRKVTETV